MDIFLLVKQQDHSNNSVCCSRCSQSAFSKCNLPNNVNSKQNNEQCKQLYCWTNIVLNLCVVIFYVMNANMLNAKNLNN